MRVRVRLVPDPREPFPRGATALVIDVLRATSTLTMAKLHGAAAVIPVATPDEARAEKARRREALLCGERGGRRIDGFDLGNSPAEYGFERVSGRTLIFASTNGSLALLAARTARRRLLASFLNAGAAVAAARGSDEVVLVCAGELGRFSLEDAACAGWLCARLAESGARMEGAGARFARAMAPRDATEVRAVVESARHARTLRALGTAYAEDVALCATLDAVDRAFEV